MAFDKVVFIKKEAEISSALIIVLVLLILIAGIFGAMYISSQKEAGVDESLTTKDVVGGIWDTLLEKLHIGAKNISERVSSFDPKLNVSFKLLPRKCEFKNSFSCEDVRVDWTGNRVWFKIKNRLSSAVIINGIVTDGAVKCNALTPNVVLELNDPYSFILDGCTLQKDSESSIVISYYPPTSSPELFRIAEGVFTLNEAE
jgi:hypothetical protein